MALKAIAKNNVKEVKALVLDPNAKGPNWGQVGTPCRPVFLVTLTDDSTMVVKCEGKGTSHSKDDAVFSARFGAELMAQVNSKVGVEELKKPELEALESLGDKLWKPGKNAHEYFHDQVQTSDPAHFFWVKMPFVQNLKDARDLFEKNKGGKLLDKLKANNNAALHGLGEIVAVDLFAGNEDRFAANGDLSNDSNIMFEKQADGSYKPIGLDVYHKDGAHSNLNAEPLSVKQQMTSKKIGERPPVQWGGLKLQSPQTLKLHAVAMKNGLNKFFKSYLGTAVADDQLLGDAAVNALADGLVAGAAVLKKYIQAMPADQWSDGVKMRLELLKWDIVPPARPTSAAPAQPPGVAPPRPQQPVPTVPPRPGTPAPATPPQTAAPPRPGTPAPAAPPRPGAPAPAAPPRPSSPAPGGKPQ